MEFYEYLDMVYLMKENHVCIYGCGEMGRLAVGVMKSLKIEIEMLSDQCSGKMIDKYTAVSLESIEMLDKSVVCIVAVLKGADRERERLEKHFDKVIDMKPIIKLHEYLNYYFPKEINMGNRVRPFNNYASPYVTKIEWDYFRKEERKKITGIRLNEGGQKNYLKSIMTLLEDFIKDKNGHNMRYDEKNGMFGVVDASVLYSIIRDVKPKRIIEIGSGYSTGIMLDVNNSYFAGKIDITCIEPFPDRLMNNVKSNERITIYEEFLQEMNLELFETLGENDILFIDSSHIAKYGSDVCIEMFEILPLLKPGVIIHIHDIGYPFTYPEDWILEGDCYNEAYMVRALLTNNDQYEIMMFVDMMKVYFCDMFPDQKQDTMGMSLWLKKKY